MIDPKFVRFRAQQAREQQRNTDAEMLTAFAQQLEQVNSGGGDLDPLKAKAAAATPGPWHAPGLGEIHSDHDHGVFVGVDADGEQEIVIADCVSDPNAAYLAAVSPDVLLALIARVEAAEQCITTACDRIDLTLRTRNFSDGVREYLEKKILTVLRGA